MTNCSECDRKAHARGLCRRHYQYAQRRGELPDVPDQRTAPLRERLLSKIEVDENGCWIFKGALMGTGYPFIWKGTKNVAGHREAYRIFIGPLGDGDVVCHRCDVRNCINPSHLFKGDRAINNQDMRDKRRHRFGERSPLAKLSEESIFKIKKDKRSNSALAREYGVNASTISRIRSGNRWSHLS